MTYTGANILFAVPPDILRSFGPPLTARPGPDSGDARFCNVNPTCIPTAAPARVQSTCSPVFPIGPFRHDGALSRRRRLPVSFRQPESGSQHFMKNDLKF